MNRTGEHRLDLYYNIKPAGLGDHTHLYTQMAWGVTRLTVTLGAEEVFGTTSAVFNPNCRPSCWPPIHIYYTSEMTNPFVCYDR